MAAAPRGAVLLFLCYVFLSFSRATEFFLHVPKLMAVVGIITLLVAAVATGLRGLTSRLPVLFLLFTMFMMFSVPFAFWRAGAIETVYSWFPFLLILITGAMLVTDVSTSYRLMYTIAGATVFIIAMVLFSAGFSGGNRLSLTGSTTIGNANDLATSLLFGMPSLMLGFRSSRKATLKTLALICIPLGVFLVLRTGSRAGLIAVFCMVATVLWTLPANKKLPALIALLFFAVGVYAVLPDEITARLRTISYAAGVDAAPENQMQQYVSGDANLSTDLRLALLKESIRLTFRHPFLGVGAGQFAAAAHAEFAAKGQQIYQPAHNSFTEVSSNIGVFGFLCYVMIFVLCFRTTRAALLRSAGKPEFKAVRDLAFAVRLTLIGYCVTSAFTSVPYKFYLPAAAAMVCGLVNWLEEQRAAGFENPAPYRPAVLSAGLMPPAEITIGPDS